MTAYNVLGIAMVIICFALAFFLMRQMEKETPKRED